MKPREDRTRVVLPARLLSQQGWTDVVIRDLSTGGLGAQSRHAPAPGSYVEIRRLNHELVGRVTWSNGTKFGVALRDRIAVNRVAAGQAADRNATGGLPNERRLATRTLETGRRRPSNGEECADRSRQRGQIFVFVCLVFAILAASAFLYQTVEAAFSAPLKKISRHLAP